MIKRFQELAGLRPFGADAKRTYLIEFTFDFGNSLNEHEYVKSFQKTGNRFFYHAQETDPPVKAHYHIIPKNSKKEIYSVNTDGTAHHRRNRGYEIPRKEADELRKLGVDINLDNILESVDMAENENKLLLENSIQNDCISVFIEFEV